MIIKTSLFAGLIIFCIFLSCKKQDVACTGNCYALNVNGKVINALTRRNAANVPLEIAQAKFVGIFSSSDPIQGFTSKEDGTFSASPSIDTTIFQNQYFLTLKLKDNSEFMTLPRGEDHRMYELYPNSFNNVTITVYPKVSLTIKLNRNQNDNFQYFSVAYYFVDNQDFFPFSILRPQDIHQTQLVVPTSVDIFTKIRVTKTNAAGISTTTLDSVKCLRGIHNTYTVNF